MSTSESLDQLLKKEIASFNQKMEEMNSLLLRETVIAFFNLANVLFLITEPTGKVLLVNPAWTENLGWSATELYNMNFPDLIHPDDLAASMAHFMKTQPPDKEQIGFRNRYRTKTNDYITLEWYGNVSEDQQYAFAVALVVNDN